eukprot:3385774-Amphidinium_carterae.1
MFAHSMNEKLKTTGSEHRASQNHVKQIVKGPGLTYNNNVKRGEVEIETSVALDMNLVHKVVYLISLHSISKDRVFNLDEISTQLSLFAEYGYVVKNYPEKNFPENRVTETKIQVIVALAVSWEHNAENWFCQSVFAGKTEKGLA